jgi:hypothetical protein
VDAHVLDGHGVFTLKMKVYFLLTPEISQGSAASLQMKETHSTMGFTNMEANISSEPFKPTTLHGDVTKKTTMFIFTTVKHSNSVS